MEQTIQEQLQDWAQKYVKEFNELAQKYNANYYTQSPLIKINSTIDLLIIGINPKGIFGSGANIYDNTYSFLKGNPSWDERFMADGTINKKWSKFLGGTHYFLGFSNNSKVNDYIDDDTKTVWTNFCPFESAKGFTDLPKDIVAKSIHSSLELINIIKPKKIVILSSTGFDQIDKYADDGIKKKIQHLKVIDNQNLFIGRINNIPTVCVPHPSGKWAVSNKFISVFIFLYFFTDIMNGEKPINTLDKVCNIMRKELTLWINNIEIKENQ